MPLASTKKTLFHFHSLARVLVVPVVVVLLNVLLTPVVLRFDLTADRQYTLSQATRRVLAELKNPITVKIFFSRELPEGLVGIRQDVRDLVGEYRRFGRGHVLVEESDPTEDPAGRAEAARLGVPPVEFNSAGATKLEISTGYAGLAIRYLDKTEALPVINATTNLEFDLTLAIRRLIREQLPKLGLLTSHGGQFDPRIRQQLNREFAVVDASLEKGAVQPPDLAGVLLVGPTTPLEPAELFALDQFVMGGGKLIALVDGVQINQQTLTASANRTNLNDLISAYGVALNTDVIADPLSAQILPFPTSNNLQVWLPYPVWPQPVQPQRLAWTGLNREHPITAKIRSMTLPWPSSLKVLPDAAAQVTLLAQSTPEAVTLDASGEPVSLDVQALKQLNAATKGQHAIAVLIQGKLKSAFSGKSVPQGVTAGGASRQTETEQAGVLVVGNSRFIEGEILDFLQRLGQAPENLAFLGNSLDALLQDTSLIAIRSRSAIRRPLKPVSDAAVAQYRFGNILGGPALAIIAAVAVAIVRRRQTKRAVVRYRGATSA